MSYTFTRESLDSLAACWAEPSNRLRWSSVFVLPVWLKAWWQECNSSAQLDLSAVRQEDKVIGISPLMIRDSKAFLVGSADICDYLDFIVVPGMEAVFFNTLLDELKQKGIEHLDLGPVRPDSSVMTHLVNIARGRGYEVTCQKEDISLELDLPGTWDEYLALLTTKQRHEVKRKLRRLLEAGQTDYRSITDSAEVNRHMDTFLKMFTRSRDDKAAFLTGQREAFFRTMADTLSGAGLLKLGILELDTRPVSMVICFDYNDSLYLYNSAYEPEYSSLSVGLLCKALCIKEAIQENKKKFDFLKGDETYKYHLGGTDIAISRCQIIIK
ncbi:MAG: GNAT family N-acetyltransferase [Chloroflexi bacterium]|nr:GNAT family N-acetyltransferase [Chloroflexota bacterium]